MAARCGGRVAATKSCVMPGVRDADHADATVCDPRLRGDHLDRVVAVERLERLEVLPRTARATGAAHVDADRRVPERLREAHPGLVGVGVRGVVARVLDDRRVRTFLDRPGQPDVDREQRAVARRRGTGSPRRGAVIDRSSGRDARRDEAPQRRRPRATVGGHDAVARAGRDVAEQQRAGRVGLTAGDGPAATVDQLEPGTRIGPGDRDLLDAAPGDDVERHGACPTLRTRRGSCSTRRTT